jgi:hypothetical protein
MNRTVEAQDFFVRAARAGCKRRPMGLSSTLRPLRTAAHWAWIEGRAAEGEAPIGSADIHSLADLAYSFEVADT